MQLEEVRQGAVHVANRQYEQTHFRAHPLAHAVGDEAADGEAHRCPYAQADGDEAADDLAAALKVPHTLADGDADAQAHRARQMAVRPQGIRKMEKQM